jgi:hypothetical protein
VSRGSVRVVLILVGLAIASRLTLILWLPMPPLAEIAAGGDGDTRYYVRLAQRLASSGEYAEGHLRAYRPPGYPAFLSGLLALGADSRAIQTVQNLLYVLAALILGVLASRWHGWRAGVITTILALASPAWMLLPQRALSETLFVVLMGIGMLIALAEPAPPPLRLAVVAGMTFGLAALVREMGLLLGGVLAMVLGAWAWRLGMRARGVALVVAVLLGAVVVILPWTVRNYRVFRQVVPISTNGPINLYIGNNREATGAYHWRLPPGAQAVWNRPDEGWSNELFASQLAGREAIAYIRANPSRSVALVPRRLWALWGPPVALQPGLGISAVARLGIAAFWFAALGLSLYGLWRTRRDPVAWFLLGSCLTATAVHAATYGDPRYRAAYEYALMLPAGIVLADVWRNMVGRPGKGTEGPARLASPHTRAHDGGRFRRMPG